MTYNKNVKKYIKQCKYLFASYGKSEKEYIRKLIDNIDDGSHDMTYDEVVERLGTPKEVIISYYEQEDMDKLIEKAKVRRLLKNFLSVALVVLLVFLCYKAYIYQKTFEEVRDSKDGYFEEIIEVKEDSEIEWSHSLLFTLKEMGITFSDAHFGYDLSSMYFLILDTFTYFA